MHILSIFVHLRLFPPFLEGCADDHREAQRGTELPADCVWAQIPMESSLVTSLEYSERSEDTTQCVVFGQSVCAGHVSVSFTTNCLRRWLCFRDEAFWLGYSTAFVIRCIQAIAGHVLNFPATILLYRDREAISYLVCDLPHETEAFISTNKFLNMPSVLLRCKMRLLFSSWPESCVQTACRCMVLAKFRRFDCGHRHSFLL